MSKVKAFLVLMFCHAAVSVFRRDIPTLAFKRFKHFMIDAPSGLYH